MASGEKLIGTLMTVVALVLAANSSSPSRSLLGEVAAFIQAKGWKEVTLLVAASCDHRAQAFALRLVKSPGIKGTRVNCRSVKHFATDKDVMAKGVIGLVHDTILDYLDVLGVVSQHHLLLLLQDRELSKVETEALQLVQVNSAFYVAEQLQSGTPSSSFWLVHTFQRETNHVRIGVSLTTGIGDGRYDLEMDYNLQGAKLHCNILNWWPYFEVDRCNLDGEKDCTVSGPHADIWKLLERKYNFTTQVW